MSKSKIHSRFGLLDVRGGREALAKRTKEENVPVYIKAVITGIWGQDDGESQEFELVVEKITERR